MAFTLNNGTAAYHIDGVLKASSAYTQGSGFADNSPNLAVAGATGGGSGFIYDDIRIYDRALSATEISNLYTHDNGQFIWTQQTGSGSRSFYAVASSSDGTKLVAAHHITCLFTPRRIAALAGPRGTATANGVAWRPRRTP